MQICSQRKKLYLCSVIKKQLDRAATYKRRKEMKAIAVKNTFNAKESLKNQGFVYDPSTKTWAKDFASQAEFDEFYSNFTSACYSGRRQSNFNSEVVFEFVENEPEKLEEEETTVPTLEEAVELVHTGKISNFEFEVNGWTATLNGFAYVVDGTTYNIPELRKISPEADREADRLEAHIAKQYVAYMERQKAAPYVKAVEQLINRKY